MFQLTVHQSLPVLVGLAGRGHKIWIRISGVHLLQSVLLHHLHISALLPLLLLIHLSYNQTKVLNFFLETIVKILKETT